PRLSVTAHLVFGYFPSYRQSSFPLLSTQLGCSYGTNRSPFALRSGSTRWYWSVSALFSARRTRHRPCFGLSHFGRCRQSVVPSARGSGSSLDYWRGLGASRNTQTFFSALALSLGSSSTQLNDIGFVSPRSGPGG